MYQLRKKSENFNMMKVSFEKSEEIEFDMCNKFKFFVYWLVGYPFYMLQSLNPFREAAEIEKPWEVYRCE